MSERSRLGVEVDDGMWSEVLAVLSLSPSLLPSLARASSSLPLRNNTYRRVTFAGGRTLQCHERGAGIDR